MTRAPHPDLRRLFALGGVAARTVERLGCALTELARLTSTHAEATLLDDEVLRALTRAPDLSALFAHALQSAPLQAAQRTAVQYGETDPVLSVRFASESGRKKVVRDRLREPLASAVATGSSDDSELQDAGRPPRAAATCGAAAEASSTVSAAPDSQPVRGFGVKQPASDAMRAALTRAAATDELRRRGERAGAPAAADTALSASAAPAQVAVLLERLATPTTGERVNAGVLARDDFSGAEPERAARASVAMPVLTRVLERMPAHAAGSTRAARASSRVVSAQSVTGGARPDFSAQEGGVEFVRAPGEEPATALRRLLALHAGTQQSAFAPGLHDGTQHNEYAPASQRALTHTPMSGVVAARLRDAELAEALDRLLRREARRQGIDMEGLSG